MLALNVIPHTTMISIPTPPPHLVRGFFIPDFWKMCPFPVTYLKNGEAMSAESRKWFRKISKSQVPPELLQTVSKCGPGELAAFIYNHPSANLSTIQLGSDLALFLFVMDDLSDMMDSQEVQTFENKLMDAFKYSGMGIEEPLAAKLVRDWWTRVSAHTAATEGWKKRFIRNFQNSIEAMKDQASNRASRRIPSIEEYTRHRRLTSACIPCFDMTELSLGIDLPEEVLSHPLICLMQDAANDFTAFSNDIFSYPNERSSTDTHNLIILLQKGYRMDLQSAVNYAGTLCSNAVKMYCEAKARLPSYGPKLDQDIAKYCHGLENWFSGGLEWNFVTPRYLGDAASREKVKRTRWIDLI